jgi:3-methyladenine DNA glycosylase AlkC
MDRKSKIKLEQHDELRRSVKQNERLRRLKERGYTLPWEKETTTST